MVTVLINGAAGGAREPEARDELTDLIRKVIPDAEVGFTEEGMDVSELARQAVRRGDRMVVAGGGDGTLNAVASALVGTGTPMGILPLGTFNHFARDLGIPLELEAAVATLVAGVPTAVDVGEVNQRIFLNNSGLGLYPTIVYFREVKQWEGVSKWPAAIWATMKALSHYRLLGIRLIVDGEKIVRRTPIVFVGNNRYVMEGLTLPARKRLDEGILCIYIPRAKGRFRLIWFSLKALIGRPQPGEDYDALFSTECRIETRHQHLVRISLDGELTAAATPLHYQIRSGWLKVIVPAESVTT